MMRYTSLQKLIFQRHYHYFSWKILLRGGNKTFFKFKGNTSRRIVFGAPSSSSKACRTLPERKSSEKLVRDSNSALHRQP